MKSEQFINRNSFAQTPENLTPRNDETEETDFESISNELRLLPDCLIQLIDQVTDRPCFASTSLLNNMEDTPSFKQLLSLLSCEPVEVGALIDLSELKRLIEESR